MAQFSRLHVAKTMESTGLVPLFYHSDLAVCKEVLTACYKGGARLLEFTHRGDFAHEIFTELNKYAIQHLPGMILGIGSVTDAASASFYMMIGANFVVTPVLREDIARVCNRQKVLWSPGCGSLSEIAKAEELGAEIIKVFPGATLGPGFVKAIKGPCPWTSVMPTGGVSTSEDNLKSWFDAGVTCVGIGSELISKAIIESQNYELLEKNVFQTLQTIRKIRQK
jgi:2-dehydro-3-deoxyphosphogluconate aldolase/(4S)-4-hydroxy-2-oxoglutarate aldolase